VASISHQVLEDNRRSPRGDRAELLPGFTVKITIRPAGVFGTSTARAAGDDTADRAQLHLQIVRGLAGGVYSLAVLRLRATRPRARVALAVLGRTRSDGGGVGHGSSGGDGARSSHADVNTDGETDLGTGDGRSKR
jgi:hypothetical protein